ncbi:MAG: hypothetical protein ACTSR8_09640 [Promethearchaeota archaeon]
MKKIIIILVIGIILTGAATLLFFYLMNLNDNSSDNSDNEDDSYPDTLPLGQDPLFSFVLKSSDNLTSIQGFWSGHNGIDFRVNDSTIILCPYDAYVVEVRTFYNDVGYHWQTNINFRLNDEWQYNLKFESWATDEENSTLQRDNVNVKVGDKILANQTVGTLLHHGSGCHVHFDIYNVYQGQFKCPYLYFSDAAKAIFDPLYAQFGTPSGSPCQ